MAGDHTAMAERRKTKYRVAAHHPPTHRMLQVCKNDIASREFCRRDAAQLVIRSREKTSHKIPRAQDFSGDFGHKARPGKELCLYERIRRTSPRMNRELTDRRAKVVKFFQSPTRPERSTIGPDAVYVEIARRRGGTAHATPPSPARRGCASPRA